MSAPIEPTPRSRSRMLARWLVPTGVAALVALGVLWSLRTLPTVCPLIYPAPPGCGSEGRTGAAIAAMVAITLVYAAMVACAVLLPIRRRSLVLGLLCGALALAVIVGVLAVLAAGYAGPALPLIE